MKPYLRHLVAVMFTCYSCKKDDAIPNQPPIIEAQSFTVSENISDSQSIGTVVATDPDGDTLNYTILENSNNLFDITDAGELGLSNGQNLDFENLTTHTILIQVSDGSLNSTNTITVNVTNEDEVPVASAQSFTVFEDVTENDVLGTVVVNDPEMGVLNYQIGQDDDNLFLINNQGEIKLRTGQNLDFENKESHNIVLIISDDSFTINVAIDISVENVNEPPVPENTDFIFSGYENVENLIWDIINATDPEDDILTYTITNNTENLFQLDSNNTFGLAPNKTLDYETLSQHQLAIEISDGEFTEIVNIVVNVQDLDAVVSTVREFPQNVLSGLAYHPTDNYILATDASAHAVWKINLDNEGNWVSNELIAGGNGAGSANGGPSSSRFNAPTGITIYGNTAYVVETGGSRIRSINLTTNITSTIAGSNLNQTGSIDGPGTSALFNFPRSIAIDIDNDIAYVADSNNHRIRTIDLNSNVVGTMTGNSQGYMDGNTSTAQFNFPVSITIDSNGNLYVLDSGNVIIRKISTNGTTSTYAGTPLTTGYQNGSLSEAIFGNNMQQICSNTNGNLFVTDFSNRVVREITSTSVKTIAGSAGISGDTDGPGPLARFNSVSSITCSRNNTVYVFNTTTRKLKKLTLDL